VIDTVVVVVVVGSPDVDTVVDTVVIVVVVVGSPDVETVVDSVVFVALG
jgi:hypothetical protein